MTLDELEAATGSKFTLADDPFYQDGECTYLTPKPGAAETPELLQGNRTERGLRFETGDEGKVTGFWAGDGSISFVEGCS
ncbi:MAG: hypothetical protein ABMA14_22320 [Hyphomonadaceae bacterium]